MGSPQQLYFRNKTPIFLYALRTNIKINFYILDYENNVDSIIAELKKNTNSIEKER